MVSTAGFVGRAAELAQLEAALARALSGRGGLCLLTGEPGIGKTGLVTEFASRIRERDVCVAWGRCWDGDAPLYWPWIQAVRVLTGSEPEGPVPGHVVRIVREAEPALVLVLDDLQWADEASLDLLVHICSDVLPDARALIVGAYRTPPDEPRELDRYATHVRLGGLDEEDIAVLASSESDTTRLSDLTGGNPFFLNECLRHPGVTPPGVHQAIHRRIDALSATEVLEIASVAGSRFDVPVLEAVIDATVVHRELEELVQAGLVAPSGPDAYVFVHGVVQHAVYDEMPVGRRLELHSRIGDALCALDADPDDIAEHLLRAAPAGDPRRAVSWSVRAAERSMATSDFARAADLYARAVEAAGYGPTTTSAERSELLVRLGEAQLRAGDPEALATFEKSRGPVPADLRSEARRLLANSDVIEEASEAGTPEETVRCILRREGDYWAIARGERSSRLEDSRGLAYLSILLAQAGREIHALDLVAAEAGHAPDGRVRDHQVTFGSEDAGAILDNEAKAAYRRRIGELEQEIEDGRLLGDAGRTVQSSEELEALRRELDRGTGIGGRDRPALSVAERARVNVTRHIKNAIRAIEDGDPDLGRHLTENVSTGTFCSYTPSQAVRWDL